jgi:hypothetical protein
MMQHLANQNNSYSSTASVTVERRKYTITEESPAMKKRKLEILAKGGLDIRPVSTGPPPIVPEAVLMQPITKKLSSEVSITVTPDVSLMLDRKGAETTYKPPPQRSVPSISMFSRTGRVYGNPKVFDLTEHDKLEGGVLDLTIKPVTHHISSMPQSRNQQQYPDVSILPQNGHHVPNKVNLSSAFD